MEITGYLTKDGKLVPYAFFKEKYEEYLIRHYGKTLYITLSTRKKRTLKENNYYWGVIIKILSNHSGYTETEMHDALRYEFLRIEEPGKPIKIKSTADNNFTTVEAEEYYEKIRQWALLEYGVIIPLPNEIDHDN